MLIRGECQRPLILRLQRILTGSTQDNTEAGIKFHFYVQHRSGLEMMAVPHKVIDSALVCPPSVESFLHNQVVSFNELASQRKYTPNADLEYDTELSKLLRRSEEIGQRVIWNAKSRLCTEKLHLRALIKQRLTEVEKLWADRPQESNSDLESTDCDAQRVASLIHQMVTKELPYAQADSSKKVHATNYERPTIAMKIARGSPNVNSKKKRTKALNAKVAVPKGGIPRPILPATSIRSRTPSSETIPEVTCDPSILAKEDGTPTEAIM
jgi:hypothetical protein